MNETATWCPDCGGEGYESHGGQAYMHRIYCEGRGLVTLPPPAGGASCRVCGKFIQHNQEQGAWFHLEPERHRAEP